MPEQTTRLKLPLGNYIGARGVRTIKTIEADTFQTVDDRLMQTGAGAPNGSVTSQWVGQPYFDTTNNKMYFSTVANSASSWTPSSPAGLVSYENAAVFYENEAVTA